jgi:UDP-N-acetylmuramoyl-L-alanyl-D-glutamate--2,6-diaminopimelate ligase
MKALLKKILPAFVISWYHKILAVLAMTVYGRPSNRLIVIGVTGTNGKSTVVNLTAELLKSNEVKVGLSATTNFKIGEQEWLNDQKMTMLGRFKTQKLLKDMIKAGCRYAVIETSSEGIKQYRHLGINYDLLIFTNLTPEHLEAHGGFANYKNAKGKLFKHLTSRKRKIIDGQKIDKTIIVNRDDEQADYFLSFAADKKLTYSINKPSDFRAAGIELQGNGTTFNLQPSTLNPQPSTYKTNLLGLVNVYNCLGAMAAAKVLNMAEEKIKQALLEYRGVPGRFEFVESGRNFKVMVDYAPEPESMTKLYETLKIFNFHKIIHVLGSCGGGRDVARQPVLGKLAAINADYVIVTNEDPYDDDPQKIIDNVATGAEAAGKTLNQNLFKILDRRQAIKKALSLAQENDLVLITGKGCEQYICVAGGKKIPWDDREVTKELIKTERP